MIKGNHGMFCLIAFLVIAGCKEDDNGMDDADALEDAGENADGETDPMGDEAAENDGAGDSDGPVDPLPGEDGNSEAEIPEVPDMVDVTEEEGQPCECTRDEDCINTNPCLVRMCSPVDCLCYDFPLGDGMPCPNGLFCDGDEQCLDGACIPVGGPACGESTNVCVAVTCDEDLDSCVEEHLSDGSPCDDGFWCTGPDACRGGRCMHASPCPITTGNPCTYPDCDEANTRCFEVPFPEGSSCSDDNRCTFFALCEGGMCIPQSTACDDSIPCSTDQCALSGEGVCVTVSSCP